MIRQLVFASCYVYSPRGQGDLAERSRKICYRLKAAESEAIRLAANRVHQYVDAGHFTDFLGDDVALVPVPGRAPLAPGAVNRTALICDALVREGVAQETLPILERVQPVPKSAYARPGERPDAEAHYQTIRNNQILTAPRRLLLVDDVVTRGATLLGAARRLAEFFPDVPIRGFALVRTESYDEIKVIRDPRVGTIELLGDGGTVRRP